jgi:hypothetical protein
MRGSDHQQSHILVICRPQCGFPSAEKDLNITRSMQGMPALLIHGAHRGAGSMTPYEAAKGRVSL